MLYDFLDGQGYVPASRHANGGGIVAATACVDPSVYLSSEAVVFGYAVVTGNVRITGRASIQGDLLPGGISTLIENDVRIVGPVSIRGAVLLRNHANLRGAVSISGLVMVMHHATVAGNVRLDGNVMVLDRAYISGNIRISSPDRDYYIRGEENIHGDREIIVTAEMSGAKNPGRTARKAKGVDQLISDCVLDELASDGAICRAPSSTASIP